ncbi:MAG TPA: hypothetical protein VKT51_02250 [Candidatus Eremiobacteraceae bacterium]|nr:hypothetical protein [Candidatus Eremiobacteraceae bacterium]
MFAQFSFIVLALVAPAAGTGGASPLREVVFNASYSDTHTQNTTSFYGNQQAQVADSDRGTVRVDVMETSAEALGLRITETWNATGTPRVYLGNIGADCSVNFAPDTIQLVTRELLGYFCRALGTQHSYAADEKWSVNGPAHTGITESYAVTKVDGAKVTIHESRSSNTSTVQAGELSGDSTVVYEPAKLVPVSGSFDLRVASGSFATTEEDTVLLRFDRVSDSLDANP